MIDEKKIEEAAKEYGKKKSNEYSWQLAHESSFKAGINWFKDNIWHDASEVPKIKEHDSPVLVQNEYYGWEVMRIVPTTNEALWKYWVEKYKIPCWLYIKDLMKGGK